MTIEEILAVVNTHFADAAEFSAALAMLKARMGIEVSEGQMRIAQAQASQAQAQAATIIAVAQETRQQAQAQFDQLVASLAAA